MAVARNGKMTDHLYSGETDGKYKKIVRDRGGVPETSTYEARMHLNDTWFGIHEVNPKVLPDMDICATADGYESTPRANAGTEDL